MVLGAAKKRKKRDKRHPWSVLFFINRDRVVVIAVGTLQGVTFPFFILTMAPPVVAVVVVVPWKEKI
jgi:hypothetical protein